MEFIFFLFFFFNLTSQSLWEGSWCAITLIITANSIDLGLKFILSNNGEVCSNQNAQHSICKLGKAK